MKQILYKTIGFGAVAALLAAALPGEAQAYRHHGHRHGYHHGHSGVYLGFSSGPAYAYPYYSAPYYEPVPVAYAPPPVVEYAPEPRYDGYCREYDTRIRTPRGWQHAYGTACRQPDGSWRIVN